MRAENEARMRTHGGVLAMAAIGALCLGTAGCGQSSGGGGGGGSGAVAAGATATQSVGALTNVTVYPTALTVDSGINSGFQLVVDGVHTGATIDVTRDASYAVDDPSIAQVSGDGLVTPLAEGQTQVAVTYGGRTATVAVTVVAPSGTAPTFTKLTVYPPYRNMPLVSAVRGLEQYQQLAVVAEDGNGRLWDLTRTVAIGVFDGNNTRTNLARVTPTGLLRGVADGEVIAVSRVASAGLIFGARFVLGAGPAATPVDPNTLYSGEPLTSSNNPIDQAVADGLFGQLLEPAPLASDGEFLRRLYADALGRTPTEAEYMAFTSSTAPDKREQEIDTLLADPAFAAKWGALMGEWFEVQRSGGMGANADGFDAWARAGIAAGTPLAGMVAELARGQVPSFETQHDNAAKKVDVLLLAGAGMTAKCAVCHDHPMTGPNDTIAWNQLQRYGLDAFFAVNNSEAIPLDKTGVRSGNNGQPLQPAFVLDPTATVNVTLADPVDTRRAAFATLLTGSSAFQRGLGHRIFAEVCGQLLNPNQFLEKELGAVTVPTVLAAITQTFASDSSLKGFLRALFSSKFYQLTSAAADTSGDAFLGRRVLRRHNAETMDACLEQVTGAAPGSAADRDFIRQVFGFPFNRESIAERVNAVNMSQSFLLMNSPVVQGRVRNAGSAAAQLAQQVGAGTITAEAAVRSLFRTALSREPAADELTECLATVSAAPSVLEGLEDVGAVLVSTSEFVLR